MDSDRTRRLSGNGRRFRLLQPPKFARDAIRHEGHFLHCGYNLTGNESGVCPECATPVPKREKTA